MAADAPQTGGAAEAPAPAAAAASAQALALEVDKSAASGGMGDMEEGQKASGKLTKQATMIGEEDLAAQRHGTWVSSVFHIITGEPLGCAW